VATLQGRRSEGGLPRSQRFALRASSRPCSQFTTSIAATWSDLIEHAFTSSTIDVSSSLSAPRRSSREFLTRRSFRDFPSCDFIPPYWSRQRWKVHSPTPGTAATAPPSGLTRTCVRLAGLATDLLRPVSWPCHRASRWSGRSVGTLAADGSESRGILPALQHFRPEPLDWVPVRRWGLREEQRDHPRGNSSPQRWCPANPVEYPRRRPASADARRPGCPGTPARTERSRRGTSLPSTQRSRVPVVPMWDQAIDLLPDIGHSLIDHRPASDHPPPGRAPCNGTPHSATRTRAD